MISDRRFRPEPMTASEAIEWLKTHRYVWYQAPMDHGPKYVRLTSKLKTWKRSPERFSVSGELNYFERFTIDNGHLDRLRMPFELWHHGIKATLSHVKYVGRDKPTIVLHQSNGFHLEMAGVKHAINFAKRSAMELTVTSWFRGNKRTRVLVPAREPISGERNF